MPNIAALQADLAKKLGISSRSVSRRIKNKEDATLQPRHVAALMVAVEEGLSAKKYANAEELAQVRAAMAGASSPTLPGSTPIAHESGLAVSTPSKRPAAQPSPRRRRKGKKVFVVHGRNEQLRRAMFTFLRALGLTPVEWSTALKATGSGSPTIMQVINVLMEESAAVAVLLTPDDLVQLKPQLLRKNDKEIERQQVGQARPNVLFEAGIAMGSRPNETVLVQIGDVKSFTDVGGIHVSYLNNGPEARQELAQKLQAASCDVDMSGTDWLKEGDFDQETYE